MDFKTITFKRTKDMVDIINEKILTVIDDPRYKYYFSATWTNLLEKDNEIGWNRDGYLIYYKDIVCGHILWSITQMTESIHSVALMIYPEFFNKGIGVIAINKWIDYIFNVRNYRRIEFVCVDGNPAKRIYDRIVRIGGRCIGHSTKAFKLMDNNYYDCIEYEILKENYRSPND